MTEIPETLRREAFRFVKIPQGKKGPFEKGWQRDNNYRYNDSELQDHLESGGNYGVVCGFGDLLVIDCDIEEVENLVEDFLPGTFKVRTGSGGAHFYYKCKAAKPIRLTSGEAQGDVGDVQYKGKQVVGPGSLHPSGSNYEVETDAEIAEVEVSEIRRALKRYVDTSETERVRKEEERLKEDCDEKIVEDLSITDVVPLNGLKENGGEYQGSHPIHGSSTGQNFCVNPSKNVWHCFRHDVGGGPLSYIAMNEGIISCPEAKPGSLQGDKFKRLLKAAEEEYGLEFESTIEDKEAVEIHLMDIEKADLEKRKVRVELTVRGVGEVYHLPKKIRIYDKEEELDDRCLTIPKNESEVLKAIDGGDRTVNNMIKSLIQKYEGIDLTYRGKKENKDWESLAWEVVEKQSVTELIVAPIIRTLEEDDGDIVDQQGRAYRKKQVYYQGTVDSNDREFEAVGYVVTNPQNSEATLLVSELENIDTGIDQFEVTEEFKSRTEMLQPKPKHRSIKEQVEFILRELENVTKLIDRREGTLLDLLTFHSALNIEFEGTIIKGWLETTKVGDTTTGKSQGTEKLINWLDLGELMIGETSSRTGFLYTIDTTVKSHAVVWGQYPLNDRKLLAVDGANYISQEEWGESREARRKGVLRVNRSASDTTRCRTRLIFVSNPEKNGEILSLNTAMYPVTTLRYIYDEPDIARLDAVVMYADEDVGKEDIFQRQEWKEPEIDSSLVRDNILWVWSRSPDEVVINENTEERISKASMELSDKYAVDSVPLISNDIDKKLARLSTALAGLLHSTDEEHEKIVVKPGHVRYIQDYLERIYSSENCMLDEYADKKRRANNLSDDQFEIIFDELADEGEYMEEVLNALMDHDTIRLSELKASVGSCEKTVSNKIKVLKKHHLIRSTRHGYKKRPKFVRFLKRLPKEFGKVLLERPSDLEGTVIQEDITEVLREESEGIPLEGIAGSLDSYGAEEVKKAVDVMMDRGRVVQKFGLFYLNTSDGTYED